MCCVPRPGGRVPAVASHPQTPAASAPRTHTVGPPAPERPGAAAAGGSTATPAVPGKTQATVPAAAASHQQGTVFSSLNHHGNQQDVPSLYGQTGNSVCVVGGVDCSHGQTQTESLDGIAIKQGLMETH